MTMDRTAIQELEALGVVALEPRRLTEGADPWAIVPDGWHVSDLERYLPAPTRARGLVTLQDAASFVAWIKERATPATRIYATAPWPNGPHYMAVMDDTVAADAPTWRQWRAAYTPLPSPEWAVWNGGNGKLASQKDFAEFLEMNADDIFSSQPSEPTSAQMLELAGSLTATTKAEFSSAVRVQNGNTSIRYSETTTATGGNSSIEVPQEFQLSIPIFVGGPHYKFPAKLRYRIQNNQLMLGYAIVRPHKVIETATNDVTERIGTESGLLIYTGLANGGDSGASALGNNRA